MTRRKRTRTRGQRGQERTQSTIKPATCVMHLSVGTFTTYSSNSTTCIHGHSLTSRCWQCEPLKTDAVDSTRCRHGKTWNEDCDDCISGGKLNGKPPYKAGDYYSNYGTAAGKTYGTYRNCDHWQDDFDLLDGLSILLSAYSDRPNGWSGNIDVPKQARTVTPDIGFYLDDLWMDDDTVLATPGTRVNWAIAQKPAAQVILFPWRDYGTPRDMAIFTNGTKWLLKKIDEGSVVEIGCIGGHGRTGTLLACLLVAQGLRAKDAISMVRRLHCEQAIESFSQVEFISKFALHINGEPIERFDFRTVDNPGRKPFKSTAIQPKTVWNGKTWETSGLVPKAWEEDGAQALSEDAAYEASKWWEEDDDALLNYAELATEWGLSEEDVRDLFDKGLVAEGNPGVPKDKAEVRKANDDDTVAYHDWQQRVQALADDDRERKVIRCALDNMD